MSRLPQLFTACLTVFALLSSGARAEDFRNGGGMPPSLSSKSANGVMARARPDYDAGGIDVGSFSIHPALRTGAVFDDNIYASRAIETEDVIFVVAPNATVESNFSRHMLNFSAYSRSSFHADETNEDNTEWGAAMDARIDIFDSIKVDLHTTYDQLREQRTSLDIPLTSLELGRHEAFTAEGTWEHQIGWFFYTISSGTSDTQYDDLDAIVGGEIDQDFRDRRVVWVTSRFGADISDALRIFALYTWNDTNYDKAPPEADFDRDSDGYQMGGGIEFNIGDSLDGSFYAGYMLQDYDDDDRNLTEGDTIAFGVNLDWQLAPDTTVSVDAARSLDEAAGFLESGRLTTDIDFTMDHELTSDILVQGHLSYAKHDFVGTPRKDEEYVATVKGIYLLDHHHQLELGYRYADRDSNALGREYNKNQVSLSLVSKL